jgi:hypothetical protein
MGKRSNFERKERDFYETPIEAVLPLIPHLGYDFTFVEPCAGSGVLIDHGDVFLRDYLQIQPDNILKTDYIITNPPWNRILLHPMIEHFSSLCPTWLLFDADWIHTKQSIPYISKLHKIVSVGRVRWFGNTTGKDNCAWYLFCKKPAKEIKFYGRI